MEHFTPLALVLLLGWSAVVLAAQLAAVEAMRWFQEKSPFWQKRLARFEVTIFAMVEWAIIFFGIVGGIVVSLAVGGK